jgi:hypothetical protein
MAMDNLNLELVRQREAELRRGAARHIAVAPPDDLRRRRPSLRALARLSVVLIVRRARNPDLA